MSKRFIYLAILMLVSSTAAAKEQTWSFAAMNLRNVASLPSLHKGQDLTYNPRVASSLSLNPSYAFSTALALNLSAGLSYEWTRSDIQTTAHEVWLTDPTVALSFPIFRHGTWFNVSGRTSSLVPLSPTSRAASLITQLDQSLNLSAQYRAVTLSYSVTGTKLFHEYTTGQLENARIGACTGESCLSLIHTGVRNASWSNTHILSTQVTLSDSFGISLSGGVIAAGLYPLASSPGLPDDEGTNMRYLTTARVAGRLSFEAGCSIGLGAESFHTQLRPDGVRQTLLFNRYAQIFVDFSFNGDCFSKQSRGSS